MAGLSQSKSSTIGSSLGSGSSLSRSNAADLTTSEGLYSVAQQAGGAVADKAEQIYGNKPSLLSRIGTGFARGLGKVLDFAQRFNYAGATAVKNVIDEDPNTTLLGGLKTGITGKTKFTYSDVFAEAGWKPTTWYGKTGRGVAGFALDVLLDPTTYVTFGASAGVKVGVRVGGKLTSKTLSKSGTNLLAKGVATKAGQEFGEQFIKDAIGRMAEKSPEMYAKFIDQGGIKFFGNTLVSGGRIAGVVKTIPGMTKLDEATQPVRNTLYALFNRDGSAKFGNLNKLGQVGGEGATGREFVQFQNTFRDLGYVRGNKALNEAIDIARANKITVQEANLITNAIESKLPLADARLDNARKLFERVMGRNLKSEQAKGIKIGELPNYVAHMLVEPKTSFAFKPTGVRVSLGASKTRTIQGTIAEINEAFGKEFFDTNIVNTVAIRSVASSRAVTSAEFLQGVKKFGAEAATAPSGFVTVGAKELAGIKFHPAIAEQIDKFGKAMIGDEATNNLLRAFDKVQGLWKASVTSIFPAFHGRNAISNVFLNFLDISSSALSPSKHGLSVALLKYNGDAVKLEKAIASGGDIAKVAKKSLDDLLNKTILTDDFGKKWNFGAIRKEITERRVAFGDEFTGFLDIRDNIADKLSTATTKGAKAKEVLKKVNPLSQDNLAFKAGRKVGNVIEQQARVLNFLTNLEKTGDVLTAAERTKQFLFDYTNLSDFEKTFMRRIIPFYTFTRKNIELQLTQLMKQPGKLATQAKLFTNVSKTMSGSSLTEEETKLLPEFLQEGLGIVYQRDGDKVAIINTLGTPIESLFANLKPSAILGSISPVVAVPLQIAIGKNFFYEEDFGGSKTSNAIAYKNAPQFIKDYIGFTVRKNKDGTDRYVALNPTRLFILNNIPPSSRVVSVIGQLGAQNVSGKLKILRQLTGIKPYGQDLTLQEQLIEKQKMRDLQDLLDTSGVAPIFQRSFIPK